MDKVSKEIVIQILLAKLESSKTFDWHELSQRLAPKGAPHIDTNKTTRPRKMGSNSKKEKEIHSESLWTGTQLHDMYHYEIVPALRAGRVPWLDVSPEPSTPSTALPTTPLTNGAKRQISEVDEMDNLQEKNDGEAMETAEGEAVEADSYPGLLEMPILKKTKPSRVTTRRRQQENTSDQVGT